MKKTLLKAVFFGSGPVAAASLGFLKNHFDFEAVITKPATLTEMATVNASEHTYGVSSAEELNSLINSKRFKSPVGIIVDFGVIVDKKTIDYFEFGIVNAHFSLLPQWRGADPITFAILSGQAKTGVSLMLIAPELDTGKLIAQKSLPLSPVATTPSLTAELIRLSNSLLLEYLPRYLAGKIKPRAQPHENRATYSRKLTKADGIIDWSKPAEVIEREIRAYILWPKSQTSLAGKAVVITGAHVVKDEGPAGKPLAKNKELIIFCGKDALAIDKLKPSGKNEMSAQEFLAGYGRFFN